VGRRASGHRMGNEGKKANVPPDRRESYRFTVDEGQVHLDLPQNLPPATVLDISAGGAGLVLPEGRPSMVDAVSVAVHLAGFPPFETQLVPVRQSGEAPGGLGVRWSGLDPAALSSLSQYLIDRFQHQGRKVARLLGSHAQTQATIRRDVVRKLLTFHAISHGRPLQVYHKGTLLPVLLRARELVVQSARELILAEIVTGSREQLSEGLEYTFAFGGSNAVNYCEAMVYKTEPGRALITLPSDIRQTGFRRSIRTRSEAAQDLELKLHHPRIAGLELIKPVLDVSAGGLSFPLAPAEDLLFPGEHLDKITVNLPQGPVQMEAIVRSMYQSPLGAVCGLEILDHGGAAEAERWQRFVFHAAHPHLHLGGRDQVRETWSVLQSSGYLEEATETLRPQLEKKYFVAWDRLAGQTHVARFLLHYRETRPLGTVAANLIYPSTWMFHHLGIDEKVRKADRKGMFDLAREIYSGALYMIDHLADAKHFLFYVDTAKAWNEMMYGRFLRSYQQQEDFVYDSFSVYKCRPNCQLPEPVVDPRSLRIVQADPDLLSALSEHLERDLPAVEYEAFCYDKGRIGLEHFTAETAALGYERTRTIFFAVDRGQPLAALIAETGEEGINIFGLFNRCWLVPLTVEAETDDRVKDQLLRRAVEHYVTRDKPEFILVGSWGGEPEDLLAPLGFHYLTDGLRWLARRNVLPAYVNYVEEFLGMLHE
jgi:PilZ domain